MWAVPSAANRNIAQRGEGPRIPHRHRRLRPGIPAHGCGCQSTRARRPRCRTHDDQENRAGMRQHPRIHRHGNYQHARKTVQIRRYFFLGSNSKMSISPFSVRVWNRQFCFVLAIVSPVHSEWLSCGHGKRVRPIPFICSKKACGKRVMRWLAAHARVDTHR